uniref:FBA_2 domain-containing protein n=2 Tax=Caenorhabditis tropicalis TaxID=1561998 RepID=A0A1I7TT66_9PELO
MKHWMTNDLKFKEVYVDMSRLQSDILFSGIPFIRRGNDVERSYINYENELITMRGGFDIQRNDGKTATIAYNEDSRDVEFWMIVWDDQEQ